MGEMGEKKRRLINRGEEGKGMRGGQKKEKKNNINEKDKEEKRGQRRGGEILYGERINVGGKDKTNGTSG